MSEKTTFTKGDLSITTADPAEKVRLRSQGFAPADAEPVPAQDATEPVPAQDVTEAEPADAAAPKRSRSTRTPENN